MHRYIALGLLGAASLVLLHATAEAGTLFSTGNPDGKIATLSRPAGPSLLETETADDFILGQNAMISGATFVGLMPVGATISDVEIELYRIFPLDSNTVRTITVPTRVNSPSDNQFAAFDSTAGDISFTTTTLNASFTAANSVVNGIHPSPNQFTGGEGAVTGQEVMFTIMFNTPFFVGATDHDFFRPEVSLSNGNFLWLSAPKPIVSPGTPFNPDLQAWIRNSNLDPDWLRIGTDITGQGPFNMTFSLTGTAIPEPSSWALLGGGLAALALTARRRGKKPVSSGI